MILTLHGLTLEIDLITLCGGFGVILFFMAGFMMIYKQFDFESEMPKSKVLRHLPIANLIVLIVLLLLFGVDIID